MKKILFLFFLIPLFGNSQVVSWDGGAGTNKWEDAENWDNDSIPCNTCSVVISGTDSVILSSKRAIKELDIGTNYTAGTPILVVTGMRAHLVINDPSFSGIDLFRGKLYNYAHITISGEGDGIQGSLEIYETAKLFHNSGTITIRGFRGLYGMWIKNTNTELLGTIKFEDCNSYALGIKNLTENHGTITINDGGSGMLLENNFKNFGTIEIEESSLGIAFSTLGVQPLIKFTNEVGGVLRYNESSRLFSGYSYGEVENNGDIVLNGSNGLGEIYRITNNGSISVNDYSKGIEAQRLINNGSFTLDNPDNSEGFAFKTLEFTNNDSIEVRNAYQIFGMAKAHEEINIRPLNNLVNKGAIVAYNSQYGFYLDSLYFDNKEGASIIIDTLKFGGIKGAFDFNNEGLISISNQMEQDTALVVGGNSTTTHSNSSNGVIHLKNVSAGMALTYKSNSTSFGFDNIGSIIIEQVHGDQDTFGFLKSSNTNFTNMGLMKISDVKGFGFFIDSESAEGVKMDGEFYGLNNTTSIFNNTSVTGPSNRFLVSNGGLIYSRGDSLYSILDSSQNLFNMNDCARVDVENIKKTSSLFTLDGLVKLVGRGSSFTASEQAGLLIDTFGEISPSLYLSSPNPAVDVSFGIGGGTSAGIREMNFLKLTGNTNQERYSGFFLDSALTQSAGSFDAAGAFFTPSFSSDLSSELFFEYTYPHGGGCSYISSIPVMGSACPYEKVDNEFMGNEDNNWHNPANWSLNVVPNVCHKAIIGDGFNPVISSGRKARAAGIETLEGAVLDIEAGSVANIFGSN